MLKATVIVPTYNREDDLRECVESLVRQTVTPHELIVVDDGNLPGFPLEKECRAAGMNCIYLKKDVPGLTASRNAGVARSSGDIIMFLDDDVVLSEDYVQQILDTFERDPAQEIGAVGGLATNQQTSSRMDYVKRAIETLFLVSGPHEGRILRSGFCVTYGATPFHVKEAQEVDFLFGFSMSFRRAVFDRFHFDASRYLKYGLGEDKDFSLQVRSAYKVYLNPRATLIHKKAPQMRIDKLQYSRMYVRNVHNLFVRYAKRGPLSWVFFWYAIFGFLLTRVLYLAVSPGRRGVDQVRGIVLGIADILRGEVVIQ